MQRIYSIYPLIFLIEWPVSICQNNSLGTKPLAQEAASCPGHSWAPNASWTRAWVQIAAKSAGAMYKPSSSACLAASTVCWNRSYYSWVNLFFGAETSFSFSVCPVLGSMATAPPFCSDSNDSITVTSPNGFVHNTLHSRDVRNK